VSYKFKSSFLYIILVLLSVAITVIFNILLVTKSAYFNTYSQFDNTRIEEMFNFQHKYIWIGYLLIPIWLLIKTSIVSLTLQIGTTIQGFKLKLSQTTTSDYQIILGSYSPEGIYFDGTNHFAYFITMLIAIIVSMRQNN